MIVEFVVVVDSSGSNCGGSFHGNSSFGSSCNGRCCNSSCNVVVVVVADAVVFVVVEPVGSNSTHHSFNLGIRG